MTDYCNWCQNHKGKTNLNFSIIDDDFGQYVHPKLIKYCPFCGRKIQEESKNDNHKEGL